MRVFVRLQPIKTAKRVSWRGKNILHSCMETVTNAKPKKLDMSIKMRQYLIKKVVFLFVIPYEIISFL